MNKRKFAQQQGQQYVSTEVWQAIQQLPEVLRPQVGGITPLELNLYMNIGQEVPVVA